MPTASGVLFLRVQCPPHRVSAIYRLMLVSLEAKDWCLIGPREAHGTCRFPRDTGISEGQEDLVLSINLSSIFHQSILPSSVCPSVDPSFHHLSLHPSIHSSVHLLFLPPPSLPSTQTSICLSFYPSILPSVIHASSHPSILPPSLSTFVPSFHPATHQPSIRPLIILPPTHLSTSFILPPSSTRLPPPSIHAAIHQLARLSIN